MLGFLFNERETKELEYILRKELEEMLLDLNDKRLDGTLRKAIENRYHVVFRMYSRFGKTSDLSRYMRNRETY